MFRAIDTAMPFVESLLLIGRLKGDRQFSRTLNYGSRGIDLHLYVSILPLTFRLVMNKSPRVDQLGTKGFTC